MTCLCDRFIVITHTQIKKLPILYYLQILAAIDYFFGWHIVLTYKAVTKIPVNPTKSLVISTHVSSDRLSVNKTYFIPLLQKLFQ